MANMKKHDESWRDAARGHGRGHLRLGPCILSHEHAARYLAGLLVVVFALVSASTGTAQSNPDRLWKLYPLKVPDRQEPSAPPAEQQQQPAGVAPSETRSGGDRPDADPSTESRTQLVVTVAGIGLFAVGLLLLIVYSVGLPNPRRPTKRHRSIESPRGVTLAAGTRSIASESAGHGNKQGALQKGTTEAAAKTPGNAQEDDGESPSQHQEESDSNLRAPDLQEAVEEPEALSVERESKHVVEEVQAEMNEQQGEPLQATAEDAAPGIATMEERACEAVESYAKTAKDSARQATDEALKLLGDHAREANSTVEAEIERARLVVENGCEEAKAAVIEMVEQALAVLEDADRTLAYRPSMGPSLATRSNSARSRNERALLSIDSHAVRAQAVMGADGHESIMAIRAQTGEMRALTDSRLERSAASMEAAGERARAAIHAESANALLAARTEGGLSDEDQVAPSESAGAAARTTLERQIRTHVEVATAAIDAHAEEARSTTGAAAAGAQSSIQAETERACHAIRETVEETAQAVHALVDEIREAVDADTSAVASELERLRRVEHARALMEEEITRTRAAMEDELERTIASIEVTVEERLAAMSTQAAPSLSDDPSVPHFQDGERPVGGSEAELIEDLTVAAIQEAAEATTESFRARAGTAVEVVTAEITAGASDGVSEPADTSASGGTEASDKEGESSRKSGRKRPRHGRPR
jgi:hypothetical protein